MGLELYMLGLAPKDINRSLEFYRRLGVGLPEKIEERPHLQAKMGSELTFFLNAMDFLVSEADRPKTVLEFYLKEQAVVDAKYNEMVGFGYQSYRTPFVVPGLDIYFAMIYDPDGNIILLSGDPKKNTAAKEG